VVLPCPEAGAATKMAGQVALSILFEVIYLAKFFANFS
jgi:hypothetical protein